MQLMQQYVQKSMRTSLPRRSACRLRGDFTFSQSCCVKISRGASCLVKQTYPGIVGTQLLLDTLQVGLG